MKTCGFCKKRFDPKDKLHVCDEDGLMVGLQDGGLGSPPGVNDKLKELEKRIEDLEYKMELIGRLFIKLGGGVPPPPTSS